MANSSIYAAFERMWQHVVSIVGNKSDVDHSHDDKYYTESEIDVALEEVRGYADTAANAVKDDLLNGAGEAYDTLKELGELIDENVGAIEALETIATSKADKEHTHADIIAAIDSLGSEIDGKLNNKADTTHTHDDLYYTEAEIDENISVINTLIDRKDKAINKRISNISKTITEQDIDTAFNDIFGGE